MKEWTRDERYKILRSADEIKNLHERIQKSVYRQAYHVQPITGLSSDPNGFSLHDGIWHLFYQWCPWGAVHGLKYWYHVTSHDLIHWQNEGIGLKPDTFYDNKGVHSGSAIADGNDLYLFYTGNHRDENWNRTPYTCVAKQSSGKKPVKLDAPLFGPRADYSEHQRDPKVFYNAQRKAYYIFIGAQTADGRGCILVYESACLLKDWHFAGELKVSGYEHFGGMWECPCIQRISGKDMLIFSPQYIKLPERAENTNHNIYLIGTMDYDTLTFSPDSDYRHLDYGFDFYAAQLAANPGDADKAIIIAWMGLPDNHYPTEEEDWEGSMTLPRELRIQGDRLIQTPLREIEALRKTEPIPQNVLPSACEIGLTPTAKDQDFEIRLFASAGGDGGMRLCYDASAHTCTIDRNGMKKRFNRTLGEALTMPLEKPLEHLQIFIDRSSVEIFANHGEAVFTSHVYPTADEHYYTATAGTALKIWELRASVTNDFVV